jgi:Ca-activated chloride channel family protein
MSEGVFANMTENFHFLRPEWFWAIVPLIAILYTMARWRKRQTGWQNVIASHLYKYLITGQQQGRGQLLVSILGLTWLLAVIALAGPTWERLPQPVFQVKSGHVVVIDMSLSMRATDIAPDRLTRAKYKAIDLINSISEGDMGLVAYAGEAFVISPLTQDANTLTTLLPSLSPEIMPVSGSDPLLGLQTAADLLKNAGYTKGNLYWITDGIDLGQMQELRKYVSELPYQLNILGVGTRDGAPVKQLNGELLKDARGSIVVPKLSADRLQQLSRAGGGQYTNIQADESDIAQLTADHLFPPSENLEAQDDSLSGDQWYEAGPYLLLAALPLALVLFRRGVVFSLIALVILFPKPTPVYAQEEPQTPALEATQSVPIPWWKKPFLNADQQGLVHYKNEDYSDAATRFTDPAWNGAAAYKNGDYEQAAKAFADMNTAEGYYNQGNALAKLNQLDAAINAYETALSLDPSLDDASKNKALLEQIKQQQEQQENQQDQSEENQQNEQDQTSDQQQNQDQNSQQQSQSNNDDSASEQSQEPSSNEDNQQNSDEQAKQNSEQNNQANADQQQEQSNQQEQEEPQEQSPQPQDNQNPEAADATPDSQPVAAQEAELTDEEKEQQQRLRNLLNRVPDDPAFLLKRKMQLEAQQRRRSRQPTTTRSDW